MSFFILSSQAVYELPLPPLLHLAVGPHPHYFSLLQLLLSEPSSHNMEGTVEKCTNLTVSSKALQGAKELSQVSTHGWQCSQGTRDEADDTGSTVPLTPTILVSSQSLCITLHTAKNIFKSWEILQCSLIHSLGFIATLSSPKLPLGHTQTN